MTFMDKIQFWRELTLRLDLTDQIGTWPKNSFLLQLTFFVSSNLESLSLPLSLLFCSHCCLEIEPFKWTNFFRGLNLLFFLVDCGIKKWCEKIDWKFLILVLRCIFSPQTKLILKMAENVFRGLPKMTSWF